MLRVQPVTVEIPRVATKDDVLPLSKPIVGVSGKVYTELPVPAGTLLSVSTVGYNLCVRPSVPHSRRDLLRRISPFYSNKDLWDQMPMNSGQNGGLA